ncbi:hypothetical protein B0J12DRAFT_705339 [Macrophomina phaseolina]|uniref:Uncharacterized protein n=1 Tax=Macrophomina phaseolina TaxID=35725 RepID=A0ABQ8FSG3_9PEZI|nr:hypothetical protein B0J12DRAFT_705339 [Macrophomina phaseolina]
MNALIDSDFQKVVDAINDATPTDGGASHSECLDLGSAMNWDFGLEAIPGSYGATDTASSWYCDLPNADRALDRAEELCGSDNTQASKDPDPVQAIQEELSRIRAELQELKRAVEAALEVNEQRITNTEKYIDELLPWTQEVHGAIERLTSRSLDADKAGLNKLSSTQDTKEA